MFERLGVLAVRRRLWILALTVLRVIAAGAIGSGVEEHLSGSGYTDPDSEAERAATMLEQRFDQGQPTFVLIATVPEGQTVTDPAAAQDGMELTNRLSTEPGVRQAQSFWSMDQAVTLRSKDGRSALVQARLAGDEDTRKRTVRDFIDRYRQHGVLTLRGAARMRSPARSPTSSRTTFSGPRPTPYRSRRSSSSWSSPVWWPPVCRS
jgi:RND superfamily putative drug exporter